MDDVVMLEHAGHDDLESVHVDPHQMQWSFEFKLSGLNITEHVDELMLCDDVEQLEHIV